MKEKLVTEEEVRKKLAELLNSTRGEPIKGFRKPYLHQMANGHFPVTRNVAKLVGFEELKLYKPLQE